MHLFQHHEKRQLHCPASATLYDEPTSILTSSRIQQKDKRYRTAATMPPTKQELSLLINPIVPESIQHNYRVSKQTSSSSLSLFPLKKKGKERKKERKNKNKNLTRSFFIITDPLKPPLPNRLPPRSQRRHSRPPIRSGLHILFPRHDLRLGSLSSLAYCSWIRLR